MFNILKHWDITIDEISRVIYENPSLRGMVFGYIAEIKLQQVLISNLNVTSVVKDDDHDRRKKGDRRIVYKGHEFIIESKSLQTARNRTLPDGTFTGVSQVDASDRRKITLPDGSILEATNLVVGEFDVLAVNCFTFANKWHFVFAKNKDLPRSTYKKYSEEQRKHLLATTVSVTWPPSGIFSDDLFRLLDEMIEEAEPEDSLKEPVLIEEKGKPPIVVED